MVARGSYSYAPPFLFVEYGPLRPVLSRAAQCESNCHIIQDDATVDNQSIGDVPQLMSQSFLMFNNVAM